jgi:hypothetical protein
MRQSKAIGWSLVAWMAVATFWLVTTRSYHPTWGLAVIVTASLIIAYAGATYVNHLLLIPRYGKTCHYGRYALLLLTTMAIFTGVALAVIRLSYYTLHGPDPDPNGVYVHYAIDFFGMAVHVLCAAAIVWVYGQFTRPRAGYTSL